MRLLEKWLALVMSVGIIAGTIFLAWHFGKGPYQYYKEGKVITATVINVHQVQNWDTETSRWNNLLSADADYKIGKMHCRIKLDNLHTNTFGYDTYREGRGIQLLYLPQFPCSGKRAPFQAVPFVVIFSGIGLLIGGFMFYKGLVH